MTTTQLAMREKSEQRALAPLDPQTLISTAIEKGASVETMERLVALAKDMRAEVARDAWYDAMAEFQRTCPPIRKTSTARIPTRGGGGFEYKFAPLDEIMSAITPVMTQLGLSVSWRHRFEPQQIISLCRITHRLGHYEESGDVPMPVERAAEGGSGANPAQRAGIAMTYGKRYSLIAIAGIAPEDDEDANTTPEKPAKRRTAAAAEVIEASGSAEVAETNTEAAERKHLLEVIAETANALHLSMDERGQVWQQFCGKAKRETADVAALADLLAHLQKKIAEQQKAADA